MGQTDKHSDKQTDKSSPHGSQSLTVDTYSTEYMVTENDKIPFELILQPSSQVTREL